MRPKQKLKVQLQSGDVVDIFGYMFENDPNFGTFFCKDTRMWKCLHVPSSATLLGEGFKTYKEIKRAVKRLNKIEFMDWTVTKTHELSEGLTFFMVTIITDYYMNKMSYEEFCVRIMEAKLNGH